MRRAWGVFFVGLAVTVAACSGAATPTPPPAPTVTVAVPTREPPTSGPPTATVTVQPATSTPAASPTVAATATAPAATQGEPTDLPLTATPMPNPAVEIIHRYLEARAAADVELTTELSCPAWKSQAVTEAISFRSMNAELQDVSCEATGTADGFSLVACQGTMLTTYGPDTREWDLSNQIYRSAPEAGEWKMCGYQ